MKRIIALVLAALMMAAVFTACGGSAKNVDLKSVLDTVNSQFGLEGLKSLDDAKSLNRYYTIGEDEVKQFAGELSTAAFSIALHVLSREPAPQFRKWLSAQNHVVSLRAKCMQPTSQELCRMRTT